MVVNILRGVMVLSQTDQPGAMVCIPLSLSAAVVEVPSVVVIVLLPLEVEDCLKITDIE